MGKLTLREILNYQPIPSKFGTSGVRGLVTELTDLEVYCLTMGALQYFESSGKLSVSAKNQNNINIPVACDLRPSSDRLVKATAKAIIDAGYQVDFQGKIPTPALTFYALQHGIASFIITGSHIPADRNGQKANRCDGEVLKTDEKGIVTHVKRVRESLFNQPVEESIFDQFGMIKQEFGVSIPESNNSAIESYQQRYQDVFSATGLKGKRFLFFQYSAVGRDMIPEILRDCGAEVIEVGRSEEFIPIDTEAISQDHLLMLKQLLLEKQDQGPFDAIISTDGDSDRPLVIAVDRGGDQVNLRFIPGDLLGIVVAEYLQADSVSVPISSNPAVQEFFANKGVQTQKTRIGSPFVIAAMQQALNVGFKRVVSWEANGGFLFGSNISVNGGLLKALPTRDAVLPILCALHAASENSISLSELLARLPKWYGKAGLIDNFPQEVSQKILEFFKPADEKTITTEFRSDQIFVKDLNDQILEKGALSKNQSKETFAKRDLLLSVFTGELGFSQIKAINTLDGIRCFFDNDEIVHIRPSGNAPQLRVYAHARTQERADEIVSQALKEPVGILRQLQTLIG